MKLEGGPCPKCGQLRVHRSHRKGFAERIIAAAASGGIRRCHACDVRFTRVGGSTVYVEDARSALRWAVVLAAGAGAVAAVLIRFL